MNVPPITMNSTLSTLWPNCLSYKHTKNVEVLKWRINLKICTFKFDGIKHYFVKFYLYYLSVLNVKQLIRTFETFKTINIL